VGLGFSVALWTLSVWHGSPSGHFKSPANGIQRRITDLTPIFAGQPIKQSCSQFSEVPWQKKQFVIEMPGYDVVLVCCEVRSLKHKVAFF
jgi:hypothetical protein